jgi:hypothetical protein
MKNVGGIFVTILAGSGVAMVLGVVRWIKNIKKTAKKHDVSLLKYFLNEFTQISYFILDNLQGSV